MDMGEAFTMALITDNHDEACYFCTADKKPEDMVNGLTDKYDEDADIDGTTFHNDAGELAVSLGGSPGVKDVQCGHEPEAVYHRGPSPDPRQRCAQTEQADDRKMDVAGRNGQG